jgi:alkylation response protein AidB-like acyl-CoA dehydrogenase
MELNYSPYEEDFRREVRTFLAGALPPDLRDHQRRGFLPAIAAQKRWQKILDAQGWGAPTWPLEFGGAGWTPVQQHIFDVEHALADAPDASVGAVRLLGPVIHTFGSREMKERFLPPIRSGDLTFGQGFSEPQSGSDLASLRTTARRDGDHYVVSGSKIWTSYAHDADMMFCLVRTDTAAKPQAGISMLLFDMAAPGVTVRPIVSIDDCHHLNEVFFDDVRVPAENLVGEENRGWDYTKFLLNNEKTYNAHIGVLKRYVLRTRELAQEVEAHSGVSLMDNAFELRLARLTASVHALEWAVLKTLTDEGDSGRLTALAPALKIRGTELLLEFSEFQAELLGPYLTPAYSELDDPMPRPADAPFSARGFMAQLMYWRASTIYGGTNDIQRGVIWNSALRSR